MDSGGGAMSFIITLYVREGIVMASDSRLALNKTMQQGEQTVLHVSVGLSDSNYKTFLAPGNIGISTFGEAAIQGVPIAGFVESFINERLRGQTLSVHDVAKALLDYFCQLPGPPETGFHVAGYDGKGSAQVWRVLVRAGQAVQVNAKDIHGAAWDGEGDIVHRLINPVWVKDQAGNYQQLPAFDIPWQFFTLQEAIDFATFALRATTDAIRFQARPKTVGGPIDVLVIKPDGAFWVQRKELHA